MNLDDAQKQQVKAWIDEGLTLSQIQSKLASELGKSMTYMEVRFLMDDLKLKPNDKQPPSSVAPTVQPGPAPSEPALGRGAKPTAETRKGPPLSEPAGTAAGGVSVTVDRVARPGALVSGRVTFSDGNSAEAGTWTSSGGLGSPQHNKATVRLKRTCNRFKCNCKRNFKNLASN